MIRYVGAAFQGLVVTVAYTAFLGRFYHLKFYETLGIPQSEASLSTFDYSLISPLISVIGFGPVIVIGLAYFLNPRGLRGMSIDSRKQLMAVSAVASVILIICSAVIIVFQLVDLVFAAFSLVFSAICMLVALWLKGVYVQANEPSKIVTPNRSEFNPAMLGILTAVIAAFYVILTIYVVGIYAEEEARRTVRMAQDARIEFISESIEDVENAKVVLINDRFVYLRDEGKLVSVPTDEIARITYDSN